MSPKRFTSLLEEVLAWPACLEDKKAYYLRHILEQYFNRWGTSQSAWVRLYLFEDPAIPVLSQEEVFRSVAEVLQNPKTRLPFLQGLVFYLMKIRPEVRTLAQRLQSPPERDISKIRQEIIDRTVRIWYQMYPHAGQSEWAPHEHDLFVETFFNHLLPYVQGVGLKHAALVFPLDPTRVPLDLFRFIQVDGAGRVQARDTFLPPALYRNLETVVHQGGAPAALPLEEIRLYLSLIATHPTHRAFLGSGQDLFYEQGIQSITPATLSQEARMLFLDAFCPDPTGRGWTFQLDWRRVKNILEPIAGVETVGIKEKNHRQFLAEAVLLDGFLAMYRQITRGGGDLSSAHEKTLRRLRQIYRAETVPAVEAFARYDFATLLDWMSQRVQWDTAFVERMKGKGRDLRIEKGIARLEENQKKIMEKLNEIHAGVTALRRSAAQWMDAESARASRLTPEEPSIALAFFDRLLERWGQMTDQFNQYAAQTLAPFEGQTRLTEQLSSAITGYITPLRRFTEQVRARPEQLLTRWRRFVVEMKNWEGEIREHLNNLRDYFTAIEKGLPEETPESREMAKMAGEGKKIVQELDAFMEKISVAKLDKIVSVLEGGLALLKPSWKNNMDVAVLLPLPGSQTSLDEIQALITTEARLWQGAHLFFGVTGSYMGGGRKEEEAVDGMHRMGLGGRLRYRLFSDREVPSPQAVVGGYVLTEWARWSRLAPMVYGGAGVDIPLLAQFLNLDLMVVYHRDLREDVQWLGLAGGVRWE